MRGFDQHARLITNVAVQEEAATGRVRYTGTAPDGKVFVGTGNSKAEARGVLDIAAQAAGYEVVQ